jgi:CRP-like cAMP-binding protein
MLRSAEHRHRVDLLRNVNLFAACSDRELAGIAATVTESRVASGAVITREGDVGEHFYVLAEGLATASIEGVRVGSIRPGSCFGEMALLDGGRRVATVTTDLPSRLLVVPAKKFAGLLERPGIAKQVMKIMSQRLREVESSTPVGGAA